MSAQVNAKQLEEIFCKIANTNFNLRSEGLDTMFPIFVIGEKGVGKTELINRFAERLAKERGEKVNTEFLYLSTQDTADLIGMPYIDRDNNRTKYARPEWFPAEDSDECHIVVCDEVNRAPVYVQQTMLPFSVGGILHTHKLPKKSIVVFLANPASEDYVVTQFEDSAFFDRMACFNYAPKHDEWIAHAERNGVADCIIEATKKQKKMITQDFVKEDEDIQVTPSNRTFTKLGILMKNVPDGWIEKHGDLLASAYVGNEFGIIIMKQFKKMLDKVLTAPEILTHIDKHMEWLKKQADQENYEAGKFGEMNGELRRHILKNFDKVKDEKKSITNLGKYLGIIGEDQLIEFLKELSGGLSEQEVSPQDMSEFLRTLDTNMEDLYGRLSGPKVEEEA